jgi:hypothetical protein
MEGGILLNTSQLQFDTIPSEELYPLLAADLNWSKPELHYRFQVVP